MLSIIRNTVAIWIITLCVINPLTAQESSKEYRTLERKIEQLKEDVIKEKIKLRQLEEAVLFGEITATTALITFKNDAEGYFELQKGTFKLNGEVVAEVLPAKLKSSNGFAAVFDREVPPGSHQLTAELTYRGKKDKTFTYFKDYTFTVNTTKEFFIQKGKTKAIEVVTFDKGFFKSKLKERLGIVFNVTTGT